MNAAYVIQDNPFAAEHSIAYFAAIVFDFLVNMLGVIAQSGAIGKGFLTERAFLRRGGCLWR